MLLSTLKRKRRRRGNNGNSGSNGNQIIHTRRNWSLKGEAYTESENIGGDRSIKVYDWNGTGWELSATVTHGATNSNNGFNPKLSRDGQTMTFGAPNTKTSAVYTTTTFD
jgi:hypothetical protein